MSFYICNSRLNYIKMFYFHRKQLENPTRYTYVNAANGRSFSWQLSKDIYIYFIELNINSKHASNTNHA